MMSDFSWRNITKEDGANMMPPIPAGNYTTEVVDQHEANWCGCCYLVSRCKASTIEFL